MKGNLSFIEQFIQLAIGTFLNLIIGVITTPIITRLVKPSEYGSLSLFNTYSSIAMFIFAMGLDQALVRYYFVKDKISYKQKVFKICFLIPITIMSISCVLFIPFLIIDGNNKRFIIFLIINIFILLLNRFSMLLLRMQYKIKLYALMNILQKMIYVFVVIFLIKIIKDNYLSILIIATILSVLIPTVICIVSELEFWKNLYKKNNEEISKKELLKYSIPLMLSSGIFLVFQAMDKICISKYETYDKVGIYASAQSLISIFAIIQQTFNTLWIPKSIEYYEKNKDDRIYYQQVNHSITILMFLFGFTVLIFKDIFVLFLGQAYRNAAQVIPFLILNPIMYTISETTVIGLNIMKKTKFQVLIMIVSCVTNFIGNIILIPILGIRGASISTGVSYIIFYTLRTQFSNFYFKINYSQYKFYIVTLIFVINAILHTYMNTNYILICLYFISIILVCFIYKNSLKNSIYLFISIVKAKLEKK